MSSPRFSDPRFPSSAHPSSARSPEQSGAYLLDLSTARPLGEIPWPKPSRAPRPAVDPNYLSRTRANDPWPEDRTHQEPCVRLTRCAVVTPTDELLLNEPFAIEVDVERLQVPSLRRVSIHARCTFSRGGKDVTESPISPITASLDPAKERQTLHVKAELLGPGDYRHGELLRYVFEARHDEATAPCASEPLEVRARTRAHWLELTEEHLPEGILLAPTEDLFARIALARRFAAEHGDHNLTAFAHAGERESPDPRTFSRWRAMAIQSLLDGDRRRWDTLWKALGEGTSRVRSLQALLGGLSRHDWCDDCGAIDGVIGPKTEAAIRRFQQMGNHRLALGLEEDGICGPKTWAALLRVLLHLIEEEGAMRATQVDREDEESSRTPSSRNSSGTSGEGSGGHAPPAATPPARKTGPLRKTGSAPAICWGYGEGEGLYACGSDFAPGHGSDAKGHDRIDLLFIAPGSEPVLLPPPAQGKATIEQNPAEDRASIVRVKIDPPGRKRVEVKGVVALQLGFFFDGTGNHRDHDLPLGKESNIVKLWEIYGSNAAFEKEQKAFYYEGVGTHGWIDIVPGGGFASGFAERIRRAKGELFEHMRSHPDTPVVFDIFGFSRGASEARHFVNELFRPEVQKAVGLGAFEIRFLGLFDTVGSVGLPGNGIEPGADLTVRHAQTSRVVHLISHTEVRSTFDLTSIRRPPPGKDGPVWITPGGYELFETCPPLPRGWEEILLPGAHSDIGGGYPPEEYVPDLLAPPWIPGESVCDYYYRVADAEMQAGGIDKKRADMEEHLEVHHTRQQNDRARWEQDQLGGAHPTASGHVQHIPRKPNVRVRDNSLSRIPLWIMIDKAREAGVPLGALESLDARKRERIGMLPPIHPLWKLQDKRHDLHAISELSHPSSAFFRENVLPRIHDSRYMWDSIQRGREVYFRGEY